MLGLRVQGRCAIMGRGCGPHICNPSTIRSIACVEEAAAAKEPPHKEECEDADLVYSPAGRGGQGGNFSAQADAALVGGIHAQQNGNACKEHKLLQPAGQAQLPIIAEHRMAAIE